MKHILILGVVVFCSISFYGQKSINDYKYVVVAEEYDFFEGKDKYQLNSLTKFLFNKYGFNAFLQNDEKPNDLINNGCLGLRADVKKGSGLFSTKLVVELRNCNGAIVFSSSEGKSREKEFKRAYQEALRDAFKSIQKLNYKYSEAASELENKVVIESPVKVDKKDAKEEKPAKPRKTKKSVISEAPASNPNSGSYIFNDVSYTFHKKEYGYELQRREEGQLVKIGKAYKSNHGNNYIVKAGELSGNGLFDSYGNFILERINPVTEKLITDTFARQ
ncbi:hypothetical protein [Aquimarina sp. MMG016]|uniref:hypothetical protein n=1 Tax=Aquimarina sp. MMG016 TaxID=2822690 RepID=UPI001B3A2990|nr:hypothetical protein [Aquimarina sp. MMG016]MBQ4821470.1 hypothetical protein [Aquimarina sp. MMG016]